MPKIPTSIQKFDFAYTTIPDYFLDHIAPTLKEAELKVMLYIFRRTLGYRKLTDTISYDQFLGGITTRDGRRLDQGAGVSRRALVTALASLEKRGLIERHGQQQPQQERRHASPQSHGPGYTPNDRNGEGDNQDEAEEYRATSPRPQYYASPKKASLIKLTSTAWLYPPDNNASYSAISNGVNSNPARPVADKNKATTTLPTARTKPGANNGTGAGSNNGYDKVQILPAPVSPAPSRISYDAPNEGNNHATGFPIGLSSNTLSGYKQPTGVKFRVQNFTPEASCEVQNDHPTKESDLTTTKNNLTNIENHEYHHAVFIVSGDGGGGEKTSKRKTRSKKALLTTTSTVASTSNPTQHDYHVVNSNSSDRPDNYFHSQKEELEVAANLLVETVPSLSRKEATRLSYIALYRHGRSLDYLQNLVSYVNSSSTIRIPAAVLSSLIQTNAERVIAYEKEKEAEKQSKEKDTPSNFAMSNPYRNALPEPPSFQAPSCFPLTTVYSISSSTSYRQPSNAISGRGPGNNSGSNYHSKAISKYTVSNNRSIDFSKYSGNGKYSYLTRSQCSGEIPPVMSGVC